MRPREEGWYRELLHHYYSTIRGWSFNFDPSISLTACNAVYVIGRSIGQHNAELLVKEVAEFMKLLPISPEDISMNLGADHPDFEDTLQIAAAKAWGADVIVTRDKDGFANSPVKALAPAEFLNTFGEERQ